MATFLDNYEDVNARIKRFRAEFPTGRITVHIEEMDLKTGYILMRAEAFRTNEDALPAAIDYAFEMRSEQKIGGRWFIETCSTSAIGRVIGLLTPSETRPTRQDMEAVERLDSAQVRADQHNQLWETKHGQVPSVKSDDTIRDTGIPSFADAMAAVVETIATGGVAPDSPQCKHGHMNHNKGTAKTGKEWQGYFCPIKVKAQQCEARWMSIDANGKWVLR
jgi:hypothetical protein